MATKAFLFVKSKSVKVVFQIGDRTQEIALRIVVFPESPRPIKTTQFWSPNVCSKSEIPLKCLIFRLYIFDIVTQLK